MDAVKDLLDHMLSDYLVLTYGAQIVMIPVAVGLFFLASKFSYERGRDLWHSVRHYEPQLIRQFDQPMDRFNLMLDRYLDKLWPRQWNATLAVLLPALVRTAADVLDEIYGPPPPEETTSPPSEATPSA